MTFQVRDLMSNVLPREIEVACAAETTLHGGQCKPDDGKCPGQSGCPHPSQAPPPPKSAREMLSALRDQMRLALLPA